MRKGGKLTPSFILKQLKMFFVIIKWPVYWISTPLFLLFLYACFDRLRLFIKNWSLTRDDFIPLIAFITFFPYQIGKPSLDIVKYQHPMIPLFILSVTFLIIRHVSILKLYEGLTQKTRNRTTYLLFLLLITFSVYYYKTGDYIMGLWSKTSFKFILSYYLPVFCVFLALCVLFRHIRKYKIILLSLLIFIYPINIGLNMNQTGEYTTSSTWLNYGERGFKDTVVYLSKKVVPGIPIFARKDVIYYLKEIYKIDIAFQPTTRYFLAPDKKTIENVFKKTPVDYFIFERISSVVKADNDIENILSEHFFVEKTIGDFVILKNKKVAVLQKAGRFPTQGK